MNFKLYVKYFFILILINVQIFNADSNKSYFISIKDRIVDAFTFLKDFTIGDSINKESFSNKIEDIYKNNLNDSKFVERQDNIINFLKHYFIGFTSSSQQKTLWEFINEIPSRILGLKFLKFKGRLNGVTLGLNFLSLGTGFAFGYSDNKNKNHISTLFYLSTIFPYINPSAFMPNISKLTSFILDSINKKKFIRDYLLGFVTEKARSMLQDDSDVSKFSKHTFTYKIQNYGISLLLSSVFNQFIMPMGNDHYHGKDIIRAYDKPKDKINNDVKN